jgi:hypothetical protein
MLHYSLVSTLYKVESLNGRGKPSVTYVEARCFNQSAVILLIIIFIYNDVDRNSSVCISTRHGLDGPGIETALRRVFPHPSRPALWPTQPLVQLAPCIFSRGKSAGTWR